MKRFLKLFPVAVAVVALASCADDNLLNVDGQQIEKDPSKLYVTAEPLIDGDAVATRAGFVYGKTSGGSYDGQYLVWTKNDQVKLYDYENNWRPQIWEYDAAATQQYLKSDGFSVFTKKVKAKDGYDQYTNGYGIIPAGMGKFIDEDRNQIDFDLSSLALYDLSQAAVTDVYTDGKLAKAPLPMWGVATSGEMKVKYLTGILKIDIFNVAAPAANTDNYVVIYANDGTNGINLHPASIITDAAGADKFDPEDNTKAPVMKGTKGAAKTAVAAFANNAVPFDAIAIKIGKVTGRTCVAVPIVPIAGAQISAYLATAPDNAATPFNITPGAQIATTITKDIQAGHFYRIQDGGVVNITDANTPYQLAQRIIEEDAKMNRDYVINVTKNVTVDDEGDDPHGNIIDLSGHAMRYNATINFTGGAALIGKTAATNTLTIKTAASEKVITLNVTEDATNKLKAIKVDAGLAGPLKLTGTVTGAIEAGSANLTIAATVPTVNATAEVNIDGANVTTLNIKKGCAKVNALNGTIANVAFGTAADAIAADVEIATAGNAHIGTVDFANVPKNQNPMTDATTYDFAKNVKFTSKWDGTASDAILTTISNCVGAGDYIISGAQLKGYASAAAANVLAQEIDLDQKPWVGIALDKNFDGNYNKLAPTSSTKPLALAATTIKNVKGAQGLFASIDAATVSNITFDGTNTITGAADASKIGLLAGTTDNATTIKNITVNAATVTAPGKSYSLGAVIGEATSGNLKLGNVNVAAANVNGYYNIGGIVGYAAAGTVDFMILDNNNAEVTKAAATGWAADNVFCAANATLTHNNIAGVEFSPNYASDGQFLGSKAPAATVIIALAELPEYAEATVPEKAMWSELVSGDLIRYTITRKQTLIGFSGIEGGANNAPQVPGTWADVNVWGTKNGAGPAFGYKTRTYKVKAAAIAPADGDGTTNFYLNTVNK